MRTWILLLSLAWLLLLNGCAAVPLNYGYNYFERQWQYRTEDETLRYNTYERKWEFAPDDAQLKYNYLEKKWEYAR